MCAAQYMMEVDVSLRTNIDYLFTMRENILTNRQKLFKYYFGQFPKFEDFDKVMTACTQDYKALVLDGTIATTDTPTECVMWYKADMNLPNFRLCKPLFWRWSEKYCMTDSTRREVQRRQYEIETAAADAASTVPKRAPSGIQFVQTEDEHGQVVS